MKLLLLFLPYVRLGANEAMIREVPFAHGKGENKRASNIEKVVTGFNILSSFFTAIIVIIIFILTQKIWDTGTYWLWSILLGVFVAKQLFWFIHVRLQAQKRFALMSKILFGFAFLSTALGILFAYYFNIAGFLLALAVSYLVMIVYAGEGRSPLPKPIWNAPLLWELIKTGFPIMVSEALLILLFNTDKLVIWFLLSKEDLGIYAIQSYLTSIIMLVPSTVSLVLYPSLMETFGTTQTPSKLEKYITQPTLVMSYLACPLLGIMFLVLHLPIKWLLPKFMLAIVPGQILIISFFFMVIARMPGTLLISLNKQNLLLLLTGISVFVGIVADYILIKNGIGIVGVAIGTSLSFVVYSSLTTFSSIRTLKLSVRKSILFLGKLLAPYASILLLLFIVLQMFPESDVGFVSDFVYTTIRCFLIILPMGILLYLLNQRFFLIGEKALEITNV